MGDAADTKSDGTVIGSPWVFSDSQPQDRASLVALDERLMRENIPVKVIAFAHSGLLANGRAPLDAFAASSRRPMITMVESRPLAPKTRTPSPASGMAPLGAGQAACEGVSALLAARAEALDAVLNLASPISNR